MPQIFEEHDGIVKEKTAEYQKALKLRRERFVEELEAYNHQVNIEEVVQNKRLMNSV